MMQIVIRGLDIRTEYEKALLAREAGKEDLALEALFVARLCAVSLGIEDFRNNVEICPAIFADCDSLVGGWNEGFWLADESAEMEGCAYCNDGSGDPCTVHG